MKFSLRSFFLVVFLFGVVFGSQSFAQETKKTAAPDGELLLENKHLRVVKFEIPGAGTLKLPVLQNDNLLVVMIGDGDQIYSSANHGKAYRPMAKEILWLQRDDENYVENDGTQASRIVRIEFKDSYAVNQMQVPGSLRDPVNYDTKHFKLLTENQHARIFLLHLEVRETSEEVQLPLHLEVPFEDAPISLFAPDGRFVEQQRKAEEVKYNGNRLGSISNQATHEFEELVIELRHPFCYRFRFGPPPGVTPSASLIAYMKGVQERIQKQWIKHMPEDARYGQEKGLVAMRFRIQPDGKLDEDETLVMEVFGETKLMDAALRALREAKPFRPLPADWDRPFLDLVFTFFYNLDKEAGPGCELKD